MNTARARLANLVIVAALCGAACSPAPDLCSSVTDRLRQCGLPATELDCERVDRVTLGSILERVEERGCEGLSRDGDAVDQRVCVLGGWACPESPIPPHGHRPTRHPVVFVSGIEDMATFDWNPRILEAVRGVGGTRVHHVSVLPWATTPERSKDLWYSLQSIRRRSGDTKLNLVCYAVGGLDCRYLVSPNGLFAEDAKSLETVHSVVASVTTIATPHWGTRVAEATREAVQSGTAADLLQAFLGDAAPEAFPDDAALLSTLDGLSLDALFAFNQRVSDAPGIAYFSWAGVSHVRGRSSDRTENDVTTHCARADGTVRYVRHDGTHDLLNELLWSTAPFSSTSRDAVGQVIRSPSDGMVSVASARWGQFEGCVPADHYDVIGQIGHTTRDPVTGFSAPRFHAWLVSTLAERGF